MASFSTRSALTAVAASIALLLAAGMMASCSLGSSSQKTVDLGSGPTPSTTPAAYPTPRVIAVATPEVWPTPWGTSTVAGVRTPGTTMTATTTPRPTRTPGPTATPAPISQLPELASGLNDKIVALTQAMATQDADQSLRAQQDLLAEADKVEKALQIDESAQADLVRQAIADVRKGASGDVGKLNDAQTKLGVASGRASTNTQSPNSPQSPQAMAASLQTKLKALNDARQANRLSDLLKDQQDLLTEVNQDQQAIANQHSNTADSLRGALQDLKDGLGGETSKLDSAGSALATVAGASSSSTAQPSASSQQFQQAAASLDNKVALLQQALSGGTRDDLLQAQRELLDEVNRDQTLVAGNNGPANERFKSALSQAKDGASGDTSKLNGARSDLSGLVGGQQTASGQSQSGQSTTPSQPADLPSMADDLSRRVDSYKQAVDKGDRPTMLRLQQELMDQVNKDNKDVKNSSGRQAEQMRSALGDLQNALQGDLSKLNSANAGLRLVAGSSQPSNTPLDTGSQGNSQQAGQDTQVAAKQLNSAINDVATAMQSGKTEDVNRAQTELQQAEDSVQKLPPDQASKLRSAIGDAREALSGDRSKLDSARNEIQQLIPR